MNEVIRQTVKKAIEDSGVSQNEFARSIAYPESHFSRVINGKQGFLPDVWRRTLDELGLKILIVPKSPEEEDAPIEWDGKRSRKGRYASDKFHDDFADYVEKWNKSTDDMND